MAEPYGNYHATDGRPGGDYGGEHLVVRSVPVPDPGDLIGRLPEPTALAWIRHGAGLTGWGEATRVFDVLDAALEKGPWILGDTFSAADIAIGSGLNFAVRLFKMVPSRPSFDGYLARCMARPAFQRAEKIAAG